MKQRSAAELSASSLVAVKHAIASAMVHGPPAGLALLEPLQRDARLSGTHRLDAVRAHLLERVGERAAAVALYRAAAAKTASLPERNDLMLRAAGSS